MPEYRKEWLLKAKIDYFAPFVNLWLSCNAWYMDHYSELSSQDRVHIDKIKSDFSGRNHLYKRFSDLLDDNGKDGIKFRSNIEQLHYALNNASLFNEKTGNISFEQSVIDYNNITNKTNLLVNPKFKKNGELRSEYVNNVIKLDSLYFINDQKKIFAGMFEIIYSIRNNLVHGKMNPGDEEYQVVKYAYLILYDLMNF